VIVVQWMALTGLFVLLCFLVAPLRGLQGWLAAAPFRGEIADSGLMKLIAEAHLLCMPFAFEGFGIITVEALRWGPTAKGI
jgi:hypothetical protein